MEKRGEKILGAKHTCTHTCTHPQVSINIKYGIAVNRILYNCLKSYISPYMLKGIAIILLNKQKKASCSVYNVVWFHLENEQKTDIGLYKFRQT